jgi:hypothetical protein
VTIHRLKYRRKLGYPMAAMLPPITEDEINAFGDAAVFTFRAGKGLLVSERVISKVSAITRLTVPAGVHKIVLHGLESDSPLAPILMWDIAHSAAVGAEIVVNESVAMPCYLDRAYFGHALTKVESSAGSSIYRKERAFDAEEGDLDEWTFGIPVGPEDATLLNACVARILELDISRKEILLCGRPASNFKYWDQVRIVGEDITAPPVQICMKKNRLVQEATFENLCIMHDRVFLPSNFRQVVHRFGNAFPLTALQSIYFDDRLNLVLRRYSDFGVGLRLDSHIAHGVARDSELTPGRYATAVLPDVETTGFVFGNAHRYTKNHYPTGSLYLVKRKIWQRVPQDERLMWTEFEDIEQGERAAKFGIPSRVNPYGVTQSLIARPILAWLGATQAESSNGGDRMHRTFYEMLSFIPRKPLIKKTRANAIQDGATFMRNWGVPNDSTIEPLASAMTTTRRRLRWIRQVVAAVHLPLHRATLAKFLKDFEKLVMGDQVPYGWHTATVNEFVHGPEKGMHRFFDTLTELFNQSAQRPKKYLFANTLEDYLPTSRWRVFFGTLVSCLYLVRKQHQLFVLAPGLLPKIQAIWASTPLLRHAREVVTPRGEVISATKKGVAR